MMLFKFPSRHHMVFGILCTLTVLIFEQHRAQLHFRPRTSICFRQCYVLVSRKMSFLIHFNFSPLACIFVYSLFMKLQFMDTLKSLLIMIQPMHSLLVFRKIIFPIHFNISPLASKIVLVTF